MEQQPMMIRKMVPPPISTVFDIDNGGSFDRLVEETCLLLFGTTEIDPEEASNLVQFNVLQGFVKRVPNDGGSTAAFKKTNSSRSSCYVVEQQDKKKPFLFKFVKNRLSNSTSNCLRPCVTSSTVFEQNQQDKRLKFVLKRKSGEDTHDYDDDHQNKSNKKKKSRSSNCVDIRGQMIMNLKRKSSNKINNRFHKYTDLQISQQQPDPLSTKLEKQIIEEGGSDIQLMIRKRLTYTDLNLHNGRLSIAPSQLKDKDLTFLTEQETSVLSEVNNELPVTLIQPCSTKTSLCLVKWSYNSTFTYILRTGWNHVLKRNHLQQEPYKADDIIQIWSFRDGTGQLYLAIDKVRDAQSI